jgi:hypothetical protein
LHRNGEIWAVTREYWALYAGQEVVVMGNVENRIRECLHNSIEVAHSDLGIEPPYEVEIGVVGLRNMCLSLPRDPQRIYVEQFSTRVHDEVLQVRRVLNDVNPSIQADVVREFLREVYALVAIDYSGPTRA